MIQLLKPREEYALALLNQGNNNKVSTASDLLGAVEEVGLANPEDSFYFLDESKLRDRIRQIDANFLPENDNAQVAYAVKANPRERILEILNEEGMTHFDCASPIEIALVKQLNPNSTPLYNHPTKRPKDIIHAARMGVAHYTVQTQREIQKILNALRTPHPNLEVAVRMETLNDAAACNLSTKFGATKEETAALIKALRQNEVRPGISVHTGSQNSDPDTMRLGVQKMVDVIQATGRVKLLNVGGGLPVNYLGDKEYDINEYLRVLSEAINEVLGDIFEDDDYKVIIEPGRGVVGDVVHLVAPVIAVEERKGTPCVTFNDGVFSSFCPADPPNFNADLRVLREEGGSIVEVETNRSSDFMVFGNTCDSADKLGFRKLPKDIKEGDYILHESAGAYAEACRSDFNNLNLTLSGHELVSFNI